MGFIKSKRISDFLAPGPDPWRSADSTKEAEHFYNESLLLKKENYELISNYDSRRDLALAYSSLANMEKAKRTHLILELEQGKRAQYTKASLQLESEFYEKAQVLAEENYKTDPCFESRRDLATIYSNFGKSKIADNIDEAQKLLKNALTHNKENHKANPCYESRQELATTLYLLGLSETKKGEEKDLEAVDKLYKEALEHLEYNYKANPCYESRHMLMVMLKELADTEKSKGTLKCLTEAKVLYKKALELYKENYNHSLKYKSESPIVNSEYTLSQLEDYYVAIFGINSNCESFENQKETEALLDDFIEFLEYNFKSNPGYTTRSDLAQGYTDLGEVAWWEGTESSKHKAEKLYEKALEIAKENYNAYPRYNPSNFASRWNLAQIYIKIGDLEKSKETAESLKKAEQLFKSAFDIFTEIYNAEPDNYIKHKMNILSDSLAELEELNRKDKSST